MSRTDRHRPWRVQEADPYEQRFYWFHSGITWGWTMVPLYRSCNCRVWGCCQGWMKYDRKKNRLDGHRRARLAVKGVRDAFDVRR